jgi:hypothetical protein
MSVEEYIGIGRFKLQHREEKDSEREREGRKVD